MNIVSHFIWQKNWQDRIRIFRKIAVSAGCLILAAGIIANSTFGSSIDDVIQTFEMDFSRTDPVKMRDRFESIIADITQMKVDSQTQIVFKSRGDVKQECYQQDLKTRSLQGISTIEGYEFLLKQFRLIESDHYLTDILYDSEYDRLYGFYNPSSRNIVILEGAAKPIVADTLFHELVHAAQDAEVDLNRYTDQHCNSFDRCLAARGLLEGQASATTLIIQVEQNLHNQDGKKILKEYLERMDDKLLTHDADQTDFFSSLRIFPYYYGLKFVLQQYLDAGKAFPSMFQRVPASTEQVIHFEKYQKNEMPVNTLLETKCKDMASYMKLNVQMETTLGENFVREILSNDNFSNKEDAFAAAQGWGGDRLAVMESKDNHFLIWDTLWDNKKDAEEFYETYLDFSKSRLGSKKVQSHKIFQAFLTDDKTQVFLIRKKNRVIAVEGDITPNMLPKLAKALEI